MNLDDEIKPSYEWDEDDILKLIGNQVEEHISLDYKASASLQKNENKKTEMSKDISAFANSVGGTVLYGVAERENVDGRRLADRIDGGIDPSEISKEWLEQVINSRIQPRIDGIRINPISLNGSYPGRMCYAIFVPESYTAHQASDKKYYKRFNFESVPMEDYEVRLIMNKVKYPLLAPNFGFETIKNEPENRVYRLKVSLVNKGMIRAIDVAFHLWWPTEMPLQSRGSDIRNWGTGQEEIIAGVRYLHFVIEGFGSKRVIFPAEEYPLIKPDAGATHLEYWVNPLSWERAYLLNIRWRLHAGDAPPQGGEVTFDKLIEFP